jgi:ABC-type nitrate/sulfonate/bicarbonate transport system ATPase subunit
LDLVPGDFLAVIGKIGCGKTSLLMSVLGETITTKGVKNVVG